MFKTIGAMAASLCVASAWTQRSLTAAATPLCEDSLTVWNLEGNDWRSRSGYWAKCLSSLEIAHADGDTEEERQALDDLFDEICDEQADDKDPRYDEPEEQLAILRTLAALDVNEGPDENCIPQ